jgi:hypothetical protein
MEVYHMDDVNGLPPQHLEIYPLKEFDPEGNFLFRHEPERKWTKWPALVEMCVQVGGPFGVLSVGLWGSKHRESGLRVGGFRSLGCVDNIERVGF